MARCKNCLYLMRNYTDKSKLSWGCALGNISAGELPAEDMDRDRKCPDFKDRLL